MSTDFDPFDGADSTPGNTPFAPKKKGPSTEERVAGLNRAMPESVEAERGLIACLFMNPVEWLDECIATVPVEAFYHTATHLVYQQLIEFQQTGKPFDMALLTHALRAKEQLEKVGGAAAISELYCFTPLASNYPVYRQLILDKLLLRQTLATCAETMDRCYRHQSEAVDQPVAPIIAEGGQRLFDLAEKALHGSGQHARVLTVQEAADQWLEKIEQITANKGKIRGIQTGWTDVDRDIGGLNIDDSGDLVVVAGFPGMGKSVAAVSLMENLGLHQLIPGAVFPLEMGVSPYMDRFIPGAAKVDTRKARTAFFSERDKLNYTATISQLCGSREQNGVVTRAPMPVWMLDYAFIDCATLRAEVMMLVRKHGVRWIIIDHFGQLKPSTKRGQGDERAGQIEVMQTLHQLRRELGITIFLMVQLAKAASEKTTKQPKALSDLRGASEIGEYCTHCIFIDRPPYRKPWHTLIDDQKKAFEERVGFYARKRPENWHLEAADGQDWPQRNYAEHAYFAIAKNRNGATPDNLCLRFQPTIQRFTNRTGSLHSTNDEDQQVVIDGF